MAVHPRPSLYTVYSGQSDPTAMNRLRATLSSSLATAQQTGGILAQLLKTPQKYLENSGNI